RFGREILVERLSTTEEEVRVQDAQHQIGVGDGRIDASLSVARGAGYCTCAPGADAEVVADVHPGDGTSSAADRAHPHHGHAHRMTSDHSAGLEHRFAVGHHSN